MSENSQQKRREFVKNSAKFTAALGAVAAFPSLLNAANSSANSNLNSANSKANSNQNSGSNAQNSNTKGQTMQQSLALPKRKLRDLEVSAVGYGCMGLSHGYGALPSEAEAIALIAKSYELGCDFFDTAEGYGSGHNETLLGKAVRGFRGSVKLATKFIFYDDELAKISPKNTLKFIEKHLDASLKRLQSERVELYYWHRVQPKADIAEVARAMGELIKKGKIAAWGLSQCSAEQLAAANAVTSVSAVQSEYSIMERMFERDVIPLCERLGVGFVAFSPLASGFLSGKYTSQTQYSGDDVRRVITRFDSENVKANQALLDLLKGYAEAKNASLAQISLAFLLAKKPFIVPIPGSRKFERIEENQRAAFVRLSAAELAQIEKALQGVKIYGNRTDKDIAKLKGILEKEKGDKK